MENIGIENFIFMENITAPGISKEYMVNSGANDIVIEFSGTASNFSATFEAKINSKYYPHKLCVNLSTLDISSIVTDMTALWNVDLTSVTGFRVNVTSVSGGNLTVSGRSTN